MEPSRMTWVAFFLASLTTLQAEAGRGQKEPWKWSTEERLAQRFAPEAVEARERERSTREETWRKRFPDSASSSLPVESRLPSARVHSIEGGRTPELLLVHELFQHLVSEVFLAPESARNQSRRALEAPAAALGLGQDLWVRLEKSANPYLDYLRELGRNARGDAARPTITEGFQMNNEAIQLCRLRFVALEAAKAELGEEELLRFLFVGVAPDMTITYAFEEGLPEHLRRLEGGCR